MNFKSLLLFVTYFLFLIQPLVQAQVVEDNTLSTEVNTENDLDFTVNAGEQRGSNLFHSFQEFSIANNGSVFFDNAVTIQNIITRVTGSSISEINGLIQSNGSANLFLLNPNGIIFGENARLDIGGSFIGTTAESLVFDDGTEFSTNLDNSEPLLTVNVPLGLQFGSNSGEIINRANFQIPNSSDPTGQDQIKLGLTTAPGTTLALIGNGITFDGGAVTSPGGNVELGSVAENSFVTLEPLANGWQANYDNVSQFRDVVLDNLAVVDASGEGAGDINVQGRNIQIFNGSAITSNTTGNLDGGTIRIQASDLLEINGSDRTGTKIDLFLAELLDIFLPFSTQIASNILGAGKGGSISIVTEDLRLVDGATIVLQNFPESTGQGGDLSILATGSIELNGIRPLLSVGEDAVNRISPFLSLDTVIEINQASRISVSPLGASDGGSIDIQASNLRLEDGASIAVSPFESGNAGNIDIETTESIEIFGASPRTGSANSVIASNTFAQGDAGNINFKTDRLAIRDGGQVISATSGGGSAGDIEINASSIEISGAVDQDIFPSLISAQASNGGDGGNIFLNTGELVISDRASISVQGSGSSVPGNLIINANSVELVNGANIRATTEFQSGGNIKLDIEDNLILRENSFISAKAMNTANGGNVDLDANFIIAFPQQNNDILASAVFGDGGNITVNAEGVFGIVEGNSQPPNITNDIDASSEFGMAGTVDLVFPILTATNRLFNLPSDFVDVNYLFNNSFCKVSQNSTFIVTGRGGIPLAPDQKFLSEETWSDWRIVKDPETVTVEKDAAIEDEKTAHPMTPIQGWVTDAQGNVVLTDKPLVVASQQPGLPTPGCNQLPSQTSN